MNNSSFFKTPWRATGVVALGLSALATTLWWSQAAETSVDATAAPTAQQKFHDPTAPPKLHLDPDVDLDAEPGYYEQWFDMRQDAQGNLPRGQRQLWYAHDRQTLAQHSGARSTSPIASTAFMGPMDVGGRTRALLLDVANPNRIFAGGISGGLWRSEDRGVTWAPLNDAASSLAVSSLTQSSFHPDTIYYGTGESRGNSAGLTGDGIWKSTDGGNTFLQIPSTVTNPDLDRIWKLEHGKQASAPHTLYAGTNSGGLYRSTDGGGTWVQVLSSPSQINDIITYADGGVLVSGHGSGFYYSPSGNAGSFVQRTHPSLPTSNLQRIEIENCAGSPDVVYAMYENSTRSGISDFLISGDRGVTWTALVAPNPGNTYSRYCMMLGVHPTNPARLVVGASSSSFEYSIDGGATWSSGAFTHADYHICIHNPNNPDEFYVGNDGGVYRCNWNNVTLDTDLNVGYHTTQFYAGFYAPTGDVAAGGTQDNGTHNAGFNPFKVAGGDGGPAYYDLQSTTGLGYQSYQRGEVLRRNNMLTVPFTASTRIVTSQMDQEGVNFIHPYTINRNNGQQVYYPTDEGLWASNDGGDNFRKVATNSRTTFYAIDASPSPDPTLYYGGAFGDLFRIDNASTAAAGSGATQLVLPSAVSSRTIGGIHALSDDMIYVTFTTMSSFPHVWKVTQANTANPVWTDISGNLPATLPVNRIAVNRRDVSQLFVGTDFGLYYSSDYGTTWLKHTALPNVAVFDVHLRASDNKLFVFTHGRGIWLLELNNLITSSTPASFASEEIFAPQIFPNPVGDQLYVTNQFETIEGVHLSIYDLKGQLLAEQNNVTLSPETGSATDWSVQHLTAGTYVLVVRTATGEQQALKFLKR